jgi:hypothetical protein
VSFKDSRSPSEKLEFLAVVMILLAGLIFVLGDAFGPLTN